MVGVRRTNRRDVAETMKILSCECDRQCSCKMVELLGQVDEWRLQTLLECFRQLLILQKISYSVAELFRLESLTIVAIIVAAVAMHKLSTVIEKNYARVIGRLHLILPCNTFPISINFFHHNSQLSTRLWYSYFRNFVATSKVLSMTRKILIRIRKKKESSYRIYLSKCQPQY